MNPPEPSVVSAILTALGTGLPTLIVQLAATIVLLVIGVAIYMAVTPFHERALIARGNAAGGVVLGGSVLSLAILLASLLATSGVLLDIVVWGIIALVIQLLTLAAVAALLRNLRHMIETGNVAAAVTLAATQVAIALLNAAAMVPH